MTRFDQIGFERIEIERHHAASKRLMIVVLS